MRSILKQHNIKMSVCSEMKLKNITGGTKNRKSTESNATTARRIKLDNKGDAFQQDLMNILPSNVR